MTKYTLAWRIMIAIVALLALFASSASAMIYMDEDFEGTTPFVNRNWPIQDRRTAVSFTQGINLRCEKEFATLETVSFSGKTGAVATDRKKSGLKSYKMTGTKQLTVLAGSIEQAGKDMRVWQFAINTDTVTCARTHNTIVGYFRINWSTNGDNTTVEHSTTLNLRVYNSGGTRRVDLVCANNGAIIGSLNGQSTDWKVVTIVANKENFSKYWRSNNYIVGTGAMRKGPQPTSEPPTYWDQWRTLGTGIHFFVNSNTAATSYNPGGAWVGGSCYEVNWDLRTQNSGTFWFDDMYWDAGNHHETMKELDRTAREANARMSDFGPTTAPPTGRSLTSPIKTIYVVPHAHLDIGFTDAPSGVASKFVQMISEQLFMVDSYPGTPAYRFNFEDTWPLQQWMALASTSDKTKLMNYAVSGRIGISAGHSVLHGSKAGVEEMNRFLSNAASYRSTYGVPIQTVMHNDSPGMTWAYPQTLAADGIKYVMAAENLFIGGGFTQPYDSYLCNWVGPDGSSVKLWTTKKSYYEAAGTYGFPLTWDDDYLDEMNDEHFINPTAMQNGLNALTGQGYPYDALMLQISFDNTYPRAVWDAVRYWNAHWTTPQIVIATPEQFFSYIEGKYSIFPTKTGDWTSSWDIGPPLGPQSEKVTKTWRSLGLTAEKAWSIVSKKGLGTYPHANFDTAWERMLTIEEHSGPGGGWDDFWTQQQIDQNNNECWQQALDVQSNMEPQYNAGLAALTNATRISSSETLSVMNPLSWQRGDIVRATISDALYNNPSFLLTDASNGSAIQYQKYIDEGNVKQLAFVAPTVPAIGLKRFAVGTGTNPGGTTLVVGSNTIENEFYRVTISATTGYITSIWDKTALKELVKTGTEFAFNQVLKADNLGLFFGDGTALPNPPAPTITALATGPVMAILKVTYTNYPIASYQVVLYKGVDRIDIIDRFDRTQLTSGYGYGIAFPFDIAGAIGRFDTAAGWFQPGTADVMTGAEFPGATNAQNSVSLASGSYGVTFSSRDTMCFGFNDLKTGIYPPLNATVVSHIVEKVTTSTMAGGGVGTVNVEASASNQWDLRYTIKPHRAAFDAAAQSRVGYEVCQPLEARHVTAGTAGPLSANTYSFFSTNAANVILTSIKDASFGSDVIVKTSEIGGTLTTTNLNAGGGFNIYRVTEITPTEQDVQVLLDNPSGQASWQFTSNPKEIRYFRVKITP